LLSVPAVISVTGVARLRRILMALETGSFGNSAGVILAVAGLAEPNLITRLAQQILVALHPEAISMGKRPMAIPAAPDCLAVHFAAVTLSARVRYAPR